MCELISQSRIVVQSQVANLGSRAEYLYKEEELKKVVNALKNYDSSFYRIYLDFGELNAGLYYGIPVPKTYDSVYEYNNYDFLNYIRTYPDFNWNFDINDSALFERLNIKYAILGSDVDETNYFYIGKKLSLPVDSEFKVFQVSEFAAMMRSENKFMSSEKIELMSLADQDYFLYEITELLATNCIVQENESQYNKIYSKSEIIYGNPVEWNNNSMRFELELKEDSFLYFSIPNDRGWKVYDNGKRIDKINVNGGFIGLEIPKGKHRVEFVYTVPGWVLGILITLGGIIMLIVIVVNDINLKKRR